MSYASKDLKWASSAARANLLRELRDGTIDPRDYVPKSIWNSNEVYQCFTLAKFRNNAGRAIAQFLKGK